jgi:histidinol-phosphate aminotransferase
MSKAFALAGLRLGYAVMPPWMAEQYRRIAPMFSISAPSLAAGVAALTDLEYMGSLVSQIVSERLRRGIIVRDCASYPGAGDCCLRATAGTPKQNDLFIDAFREANRPD